MYTHIYKQGGTAAISSHKQQIGGVVGAKRGELEKRGGGGGRGGPSSNSFERDGRGSIYFCLASISV